ncbi:hypothetical protein jhhlp_007174 [Lomentospora prolificans]|uniref:Trafficking protein particle complex II-specific subunit 65 IgD3 domain-containing protein n=1 Tax=Lomentospora prolificans TaxID=41688 RepID=A0A2N3N1W5_9PEZI|nr:hypothetical protein jhhlp_007174 [Lomentospora prolificans]
MAVPENNLPLAGDSDTRFVEQSHLSYMIPFETDLNLEEAFRDVDASAPLLDSVPRRKSLFFDETVEVLLVLRTPWTDEKTLRSHLTRLVISLETHIVNTGATDHESPSPPGQDVIFTGTLQDMDDPFIIVDESDASSEDSDEDQHEQHVYAIWKMSVFLARPRLRLRRPFAVFHASAGLQPAGKAESAVEAGYLQSGVPLGLNLLEAFGNDPALRGVKPRLSALRVSRVAPLTDPKELTRSIKALKELKLDITPAVHARVRIARPTIQPPNSTLIAVLEVDFSGSTPCEISIDSIAPQLKGGTVEDLNARPDAQLLPMACVAHDHVTFLYSLLPSDLDDIIKNPIRDLDITIKATAKLAPKCTPKLSLSWVTPLDFTVPVNPGFGPAMQPIQRSHRPSQLSISGGESSFTAPSVSRPDALPTLEAATTRTEATIPDLGITITFSAPDGPIYPGDAFSWTIYIVNRSSDKNTAPPRKLAILALPKRRRDHHRVTRPPSISHPSQARISVADPGHIAPSRPGPDAEQIADAVLDDNIVHAMHKNSMVDSADVVCLSSDVRVGPLAPGTCHVAELKFMALREGVLGVEAVRVVDLGSQEHVDVRELPVIIVEARP